MMSYIDETIKPCDDFYKFSCGGLQSNPNLNADVPNKEIRKKIQARLKTIGSKSPPSHINFKRFYDNCINYEDKVNDAQRMKKARDLLNSIGKFYNANDDGWDSANFNFTKVIIDLLKHSSFPLFEVLLDVSAESINKFMLILTPPLRRPPILDIVAGNTFVTDHSICYKNIQQSLPKNGEKMYFNDVFTNYSSCMSNYTHRLKRINTAINKTFEADSETNQETSMLLEDLLTAKVNNVKSFKNVRENELRKNYTIMTVSELQNEFSMVDWVILFTELTAHKFNDNDKIQVYFLEYFKSLFEELLLAEVRFVNNVMMGIFANDLYYGLVLPRTTCDIETICIKSAINMMSDVASQILLSTYKTDEINDFKTKTDFVVKQIKSSLEDEINSAEWLKNSHELQQTLLDKVESLNVELGLESSYINPQFFEKFPITGDYFDMFIFLQKRLRKRIYSMYTLDALNSTQIWNYFSDYTKTTPNTIYGLNSVLVPLGVFTKPNWIPGAPNYIQMSNLGSLIAHEIAHIFDTTGINYNRFGRKSVVLSDNDKNNYDELKRCNDKQFEIMRKNKLADGSIVEYKLDSSLSLNERISDQSGVYLAYTAYSKWLQNITPENNLDDKILPFMNYTWDQLYFISLAQSFCTKEIFLDYRIDMFKMEHLPSRIRVGNIMSNSKEFYQAFSCNEPSKNKKCPAFPALNIIEK